MPGRLHLTAMGVPLPTAPTGRPSRRTRLAAAVLLSVLLAASTGGADALRSMLAEAYDEGTAERGDALYRGLALGGDDSALILKAVELMVEAGYSAAAPLDYLGLSQTLAAAGIGIRDITNKVREGIAKKIGEERLLSVIDRRSQALRDARVQVISCEEKGVVFLDRQMAYTVFADYMSRGIPAEKLRDCLAKGALDEFPSLANLVR